MLAYGNRLLLKEAGNPSKVPRSALFGSGTVCQFFQQAPDLIQLPGLLRKGATDIMKLCCQSLRRGMDRYRVRPSAHDGLNCRSGGQFRDSV